MKREEWERESEKGRDVSWLHLELPRFFSFSSKSELFRIRNRDDNFRKFCRSSSESVIILEIIIFRKFEKNHFQSFFDEMFRIFGRFCSGIFLADWKKNSIMRNSFEKKNPEKNLLEIFLSLKRYKIRSLFKYPLTTTPSASPRQGTRLTRPDPWPQIVGTLKKVLLALANCPWVPQLSASSIKPFS